MKKEINLLEKEFNSALVQMDEDEMEAQYEAVQKYLRRNPKPIRPAYPAELLCFPSNHPTDIGNAAIQQEILLYLEEYGEQPLWKIIDNVELIRGVSEQYAFPKVNYLLHKGILLERRENRTTYYYPNPDMTKFLNQKPWEIPNNDNSIDPKNMTAKQHSNMIAAESVVDFLKDNGPMTMEEIHANFRVFRGVGERKVKEVLIFAEDEDMIESFEKGRKTYYRVVQ